MVLPQIRTNGHEYDPQIPQMPADYGSSVGGSRGVVVLAGTTKRLNRRQTETTETDDGLVFFSVSSVISCENGSAFFPACKHVSAANCRGRSFQ